jgi:hypothetical protein
MANMEISESLRRKIIDSISGVTSTDGDEVYCRYDTISFNFKSKRIEFSYLGEQMMYLDMPSNLLNGDSISISGLEGRAKVIQFPR